MMIQHNYLLNRSKKWLPATSYADARQIAIENGADVQHKAVR